MEAKTTSDDAIKALRRDAIASIKEQKTHPSVPRYFYLLIEPDKDVIRYVGCCSDPVQRYRNHTANVELTTPVGKWIKALKANGKLPRIEIIGSIKGVGFFYQQLIHTTGLGEVVEQEIISRLRNGRWVGNHKMKSDLLNVK